MLKFLVLSALLLCGVSLSAQSVVAAKKIKATDLPKTIKIRGKIFEAWQWNDKLGDNILVLSVLGPYAAKSADTEDGQTVELFANHFYKTDSVYKALWRLNDLVKACELDYVASFVKDATTITDLDKDGKAETVVQYKLACRGDVSPSYMKLIMHEDSTKYALRGSMWLDGAAGEAKFTVNEKNADLQKLPKPTGATEGEDEYLRTLGRYETEKEFAKAPPEFLQHARRQWLKHVKEKFD
jgi:hypothetical protein